MMDSRIVLFFSQRAYFQNNENAYIEPNASYYCRTIK